jgi:hypothetical protein
MVGGLAANRGGHDAGPPGQDLPGLSTHPPFGVRVAFGVETPGSLPDVLDDVDEVHDDRYGDLPGVGFGVDPVDLVEVAVDQGDPGPSVVGVTAVGLGEPGRDHRRGVVGHAGVQPLARSDRRRGSSPGRFGVLGQDVRHGTRLAGHVEDRGDLAHPLAVALLALGTASGQLLAGGGLGSGRP